MARGWESKSVEAQIEDSNNEPSLPKTNLVSSAELEVKRKKADLTLSRKRVLQQLEHAANERYSQLLRQSLTDLDAQIAALK